jgi:hypothetical protein
VVFVVRKHSKKRYHLKFTQRVLFIENKNAARLEGYTRSQAVRSSARVYAIDHGRRARSLITASETPRQKDGSNGG